MIRPLRNLIAFASAAVALTVATPAHAAFDVSTAVASVSYTDSTGTTNIDGPVAAFTVNGTTFTFAQYASTGNDISAIVNSSMTASDTYAGPDVLLTISEAITITSDGVTGSTPFIQTIQYNLTTAGLQLVSTTVSPAQQTINGTLYTADNPLATENDLQTGRRTVQFSTNISGTSAVPEPASVVMLGLGLIGTAGFAARRRRV